MKWMHGFNLKVNAWLNHTIIFKELSVSSLNSWNKIRLKFWKWILTFSFFLFLVNENDFIGKLHHFHSILLNYSEDRRFVVFLFIVAFLNVDDDVFFFFFFLMTVENAKFDFICRAIFMDELVGCCLCRYEIW